MLLPQRQQLLDILSFTGLPAPSAIMNQQPAVQNQAQAQAQAPNAAGQDGWDEARLEEAMKRLKLLHIKVTSFST